MDPAEAESGAAERLADFFGHSHEPRIVVSPSYLGDSYARPEAARGEGPPSKTVEVARTQGILGQREVAPEPQPAAENLFRRLRSLMDEVGGTEVPSVEPSRGQAGVRSGAASDDSRKSQAAQVRKNFTQGLLQDLTTLQASAGTHMAALPANRMLHDLRDLRDLLPFDNYVEVAMALYDGLVFEDRWLELSAEQYEGIHGIFAGLPRDRELSDEEVARAILAIESLGIDTTPLPAVAGEHPGEEIAGDGER